MGIGVNGTFGNIIRDEPNYCTCGYCQYRYLVDWDKVKDLNKMVCPNCNREGEQGSDY